MAASATFLWITWKDLSMQKVVIQQPSDIVCFTVYLMISWNQGGMKCGSSHVNWWTWFKYKETCNLLFSQTTPSQLFFKICLYAKCFDSLVCPHEMFQCHFDNSPKRQETIWCNKFEWRSLIKNCFLKV